MSVCGAHITIRSSGPQTPCGFLRMLRDGCANASPNQPNLTWTSCHLIGEHKHKTDIPNFWGCCYFAGSRVSGDNGQSMVALDGWLGIDSRHIYGVNLSFPTLCKIWDCACSIGISYCRIFRFQVRRQSMGAGLGGYWCNCMGANRCSGVGHGNMIDRYNKHIKSFALGVLESCAALLPNAIMLGFRYRGGMIQPTTNSTGKLCS